MNSISNSELFERNQNLPTIENSEKEMVVEDYKINRANIGMFHNKFFRSSFYSFLMKNLESIKILLI